MNLEKITESLADIHNEFERHYKSNFDSEEQFLEVIKLDPSSFPKQGNGYDMTADPERVGQLASGNGLLIRCWNNGERDFLNYKDDVIRAGLEFLQNRKSFDIKNPGAFPSVKDFVDYVLNKKEITAAETEAKPKNKNVSIDDKFETYYAKDFDRSVFDQIIVIDPQTEIESNKIGDIAQQVFLRLLPGKNLDWLEDKLMLYKLKKFCQFYYSRLITLSVKSLNQYTSWENFLEDVESVLPPTEGMISKTWPITLYKNKEPNVVEGKDYEILGVTRDYTIFHFLTYNGSHQLDWPQIDGYIQPSESPGNRLLDWCTGWSSSYFGSYISPSNGRTGLSFAPNNPQLRVNKYEYMQIGIVQRTTRGVTGALNGRDGTSGSSWDGFGNRKRSELRQDTYKNDAFQVSSWSTDECYMFSFFLKYPSVLPFVIKEPTFRNHRVTRAALDCTTEAERNDAGIGEPINYTYTGASDFEEWRKTNSIGNIAELTIGENVTEIPDYTFEGAYNILKINFAKTTNLKRIGIRAFARCKSLTKVDIPEGVEEIGLGAFSDCVNLSGSIRLPLSIRRIYPYAFKGHNKKGVRFTLPDTFISQHAKLIVPNANDNLSSEQEVNWWRAANRFTFRNN